jgi:hypothetical protein
VIAKHPKTTFICALFGNNAEDLATVGKWLERRAGQGLLQERREGAL